MRRKIVPSLSASPVSRFLTSVLLAVLLVLPILPGGSNSWLDFGEIWGRLAGLISVTGSATEKQREGLDPNGAPALSPQEGQRGVLDPDGSPASVDGTTGSGTTDQRQGLDPDGAF